MSQPPKLWRFLKWAVLLVLSVPVLLLIASATGFFPWSEINCTHDDVDIHTGRTRHSRYLLLIPVGSKIEDSALTKALSPEDIANVTAEWHHCVTLSPGYRYSPHYVFHGAIYQIEDLTRTWDRANFTVAARRGSAKNVLALWQQTGSDSRADDYLKALRQLTLADDSKGKTIDVEDLPK